MRFSVKCKFTIAVLSFVVLGLVVSMRNPAGAEGPDPEESFDSPRLAALAKQMRADDAAGNRKAIDKFLKELEGKAPLIEPIAGVPHWSWVTFLWRGDDQTHRMSVLGGPPTADYGARLKRLQNSDLWYRTDRVPSDARFVYRFIANVPDKIPEDPVGEAKFFKEHPLRDDPLNPRKAGGMPGSIAELPEAPAQPWLQRLPGAPALLSSLLDKALPTREIKEFKLKSDILKQERTYAVFTPPQYDPKGAPCGLLVMFDGNGLRQTKGNSFPVPVILDNLIIEKKIPPLVTVFVYQTAKRNQELSCSETFADFVAKEMIPRVREDYRVSAEPARTVVSGLSLGGLMSSYCAFRHPEVFGNVLSLSGSYQWFRGAFDGKAPPNAEPGWLTHEFVTSPRLPVAFFLTAGRFENFHPYSLLGENRRFRDVLLAKGYSVVYSEFSGGHDPVCWRGPFVDGLIALTNAKREK
jgi:enterochelin esterase-like enzyme